MLVVRWIVLWIAYILIFVAVGAIISIAAAEIDRRKVKSSGMAALGWWVPPMLIYWALCIVAVIVVITLNLSLRGVLNTLAIFLPGVFLGSGAVFFIGPFWASRREK